MSDTETMRYADLLTAASAAKTALRMLRSEFAKPDLAMEQALEHLEETVASVEDQIHPMTGKELLLFGDFRWMHRRHWDQFAWSIERIAEACDGKTNCSEKYDYLRVEIAISPKPKTLRRALEELANYIELVTDYDIFAECQSL